MIGDKGEKMLLLTVTSSCDFMSNQEKIMYEGMHDITCGRQ